MTRAATCIRGAAIVVPRDSDSVRQLAGREMQRFVYLLTGVESPVVQSVPPGGVAISIGVKSPMQLGVTHPEHTLGRDGFAIRTEGSAAATTAHLAALSSRGLLNAAYTLLEDLGVGFYLGGETLPDRKIRAVLPANYQRTEKPAFAVRGQLLHDNTLIGTTGWGETDYRSYFSRMARLRCNTVLLLWYSDQSPESWHEDDGRLLNSHPVMSSLTRPWGAVEALRTSQFCYGTGDYFDEEVFGHPALALTRDPAAQRRLIGENLANAIRYSRLSGLDVATGFVAPVGDVNHPADPMVPRVREAFQRRVRSFLERNPDLGYFMLTNHESGGCCGTRLPADSPGAARLFKSQQPIFAYLGNARRVWEAIRFGCFAQLAWEVLQQEAPRVRLVLNGWGGDRWMRFADYAVGFDRILPPDVIFTCHDNIESTVANTVSAAWGKLPARRERWAISWIENDNSDFWTPQPNVTGLQELATDARRKGCQGLAVMTWRTRDFEEEVGYAARFSWESRLTPEQFYAGFARNAFGPAHANRMAAHLLALQRLGKRWTGVKGTPEIAPMDFTGSKPHLPFEMGPEVARFLLPFARDAARKLAEPYADEQDLANLADELLKTRAAPGKGAPAEVFSSQLGVAEFNQISRRLQTLSKERDSERIRQGMTETVEIVFGIRDRLIRRGLTPAQFGVMDIYWIHAHQLARFAGPRRKLAELDRIAADVRKLRQIFVARNDTARLERIDYLLANLDFTRGYDRVAMLLAPGAEIETAIQRGQTLVRKGRVAAAREVAAAAYRKLIAGGFRETVLALTRKLSTQCEWGILATINIKPVAKYFELIGRLEAFMPASPPRQIFAQLCKKEVHVWWDPPSGPLPIKGYHLYRQDSEENSFKNVAAPLLSPTSPVFIDRPKSGRRYRYEVTSVSQDGWESPPSYAVEICTDGVEAGPQIIVRQPPTVLWCGEAVEVRAIVRGACPIAEVGLHYRSSREGDWRKAPMFRRYRCAYCQVIPSSCVKDGILAWYIEARDENGRRAYWPATAPKGRSWTATVVPHRSKIGKTGEEHTNVTQ